MSEIPLPLCFKVQKSTQYNTAITGYRNNVFIFYNNSHFKVFDIDQMNFQEKNYDYLIKSDKGYKLKFSIYYGPIVFRDKFYIRLVKPSSTAVFMFAVFDPKSFFGSAPMENHPYVLDTIVCDTKQPPGDFVFDYN